MERVVETERAAGPATAGEGAGTPPTGPDAYRGYTNCSSLRAGDAGRRVTLDVRGHVGFGPAERPALEGAA